MDLTKLSNEDLLALQAGDYSKVSDAGLQYLRGAQSPESSGPELRETPTGAPDIREPGAEFWSEFRHLAPEQKSIVEGVAGGGVGGGVQIGGKVISNLASKVPGVLAKFLKPAAERSAMLSRVKDEAKLAPYVGEQIQQASNQFAEKQITPRMLRQYEIAGERTIPFNPDEFRGIHPSIDAEMDAIAQSGGMGHLVSSTQEVPIKKVLELRAKLNDRTLFRDLGPYTPEVAARQSAAYDAGNKLRRSIELADPSITAISDELRDAYRLRDAVVGTPGKRPVEAITAPMGSTKGSNLARFDELAGTDLRSMGQNIETARERLGSTGLPSIPTSTSALPRTAKKAINIAPRAYDALAELIQPVAAGTEEILQTPAAGSASYIALKRLLEEQNQGR